MSRELGSWMINAFKNNSALVALLGRDSSGFPAVFPDQMNDTDERVPYPHLTVTRVDSLKSTELFDAQPDTAAQMDCPVMAICAWSTVSKDEAYEVYTLADEMLRGNGITITNEYFAGYSIRRRVFKDNLYDPKAQAYHIHAEYGMWVALMAAQPF